MTNLFSVSIYLKFKIKAQINILNDRIYYGIVLLFFLTKTIHSTYFIKIATLVPNCSVENKARYAQKIYVYCNNKSFNKT